MVCKNTNELLQEYGPGCEPTDIECWQLKGINITNGPFDNQSQCFGDCAGSCVTSQDCEYCYYWWELATWRGGCGMGYAGCADCLAAGGVYKDNQCRFYTALKTPGTSCLDMSLASNRLAPDYISVNSNIGTNSSLPTPFREAPTVTCWALRSLSEQPTWSVPEEWPCVNNQCSRPKHVFELQGYPCNSDPNTCPQC